ncbi:MAG: hypothetical protein MJ185_02170 [Treponema sp.]|nr:hypothetical protein [Treponema sp.]
MEKNQRSRRKSVFINISTALFSNVILSLVSFFTSRIIKDKLGLDVLGLNGVLTNIISILSLTEMGIGSAISFALYKPLAENDTNMLKAIMRFYKKAYNIVALVILLLGLLILPFIKIIIQSDTFNNYFVYKAYLLFLINSVLSYLLIYKRTLIIADQKNYIVTSCTLVFTTISKVGSLIVVVLTSNYFLFLLVGIVCTVLTNLYISLIANKLYPFLKEKDKIQLDIENKNIIMKKIKALFFHSIGSVIVFGTDNILVSYFSGISDAGRYTSYLTIINMVGTIISIAFANLQDSVGNFLVTSSEDEKYNLFKKLFFLNQSFVLISSVCLLVLMPSFMKIWLGADVLFDNYILYALVISFALTKGRLPLQTVKNAAGLFEQDQWAPIAESIINLLVSIILGKYFGVLGVVIGTITSTFLIPFFVSPVIVFKNIFFKKSISFFLDYFLDVLFIIICYLIVNFITDKFFNLLNCSLLEFFLASIFVFISTSFIWGVLNSYKIEERVLVNKIIGKVFRK